jgi:hypothetical protein
MEFETPVSFSESFPLRNDFLMFLFPPGQDAYGAQGPKSGRIKCNIGVVYISSIAPQPLIVTGQTHPGGYPTLSTAISRATHTSTAKDDFTGYDGPTGINFEWEADSRAEGGGRVRAELTVPLSVKDGEGGLIEKVNVLAEIPYLVRKALSAVAGIAPYIFQVSIPAKGMQRTIRTARS